jgi:AraC-like DNA-binding protein
MPQDTRNSALKPFGAGRIALWRGGSVWVGNADATGVHAHHAIQITLPLSDRTVRLRRPGEEWSFHAGAIIAANQEHAFEGQGALVALVFAEPESRQGLVLQQRYPEGISALDPALLAQECSDLADALAQGVSDEELVPRARAVIFKLTSLQELPARPLDARIARAIEVIKGQLDEAVTMAQIARAVHLSPERFRHLFLEQTGMRFRPYLLWLRIELAVAAWAAGATLTEAAHAGGFADSAHLSRTFKRMFGVPAISVQRA